MSPAQQGTGGRVDAQVREVVPGDMRVNSSPRERLLIASSKKGHEAQRLPSPGLHMNPVAAPPASANEPCAEQHSAQPPSPGDTQPAAGPALAVAASSEWKAVALWCLGQLRIKKK